MGQADRARAALLTVPQAKGAIVIAASHTKALAGIVKRHQGGADNIQFWDWLDQPDIQRGLLDPIAVGGHARCGCVMEKKQVSFAERVEDRQVDIFTLLPQPFDHRHRIELAVIGKVKGNVLGIENAGGLLAVFE